MAVPPNFATPRGDPAQLLELEQLVVDAWPADETFELDGWLLRKSGGPTNRGNSVSTLRVKGRLPLDARIEQTEAWYRARNRAISFQLGPCAAPRELDAALAARGYRRSSDSVLAIA